MSEEINQVERGICPTPGCGARLPIAPIGGVTLLHASFPQEPLLVGSLLKGSMTHVYCSQCGQRSPYHSSALCFVGPIHTAFVYVPAEVAELHPEVIVELRSKLEEAVSTLEGGRIEIITNAAEYRKQLAAAISSLVVPLLNDFFLAHEQGETGVEEWLLQNKERLDRTFFAGALLLIQKAIPCYVIIATKESDVDEDMAVNIIHDQIQEMLTWRALQLARQLVADELLSSVEEVVVRAIHPVIVDTAMAKFLAGAVAHFEKRNDTPSLYNYAYHAVLAAICDLANQENPRQEHWAGWYIAFELSRRTSKNQSAFRGNTVPLTFAKRTITPEQFWDQLGPRFNQAMQQYDKEALELLHDVAEDLELEDLQQWLAHGITPIFDGIPEDTLEETLEAAILPFILQEPDASLPLIKSCLRGLANRNPMLVITFGKKLRSSLWASGQKDQSIWVTCYMSEILNDFDLSLLAKRAVDDWIEELKKTHSWPPESKGAYVALLTEKGNCLRYAGEPLASLECYELCKNVLSDDLSNRDVRTNGRNRAIVLREVGKVRESLSILSKLLPHTRSGEKAMVLSSISACQNVLGHRHRAEAMLRQALAILPSGRMVDSLRLSLLMDLAFLARKEHNFDLALASAIEALDIARDRHNLWVQLAAIGLASSVTKYLPEHADQRFDMLAMAIQILEAITHMPEVFRPPLRNEIALRVLLSELFELTFKLK